MSRLILRSSSGLLAAMLIVGLLPTAALAAAPNAIAGTASTNEDAATVITLVGTDDDADGLTFSIDTEPTNGELSPIGTPDCSIPSICTADVTYTPDPNYHGIDAITFEVTDGTDTGSATVDITVDSVNDAPAGTNKTVAIDEGSTHTFASADFGFTDPDDSPDDAMAAVRIASLPGPGTLERSGVAVTVNQSITVADLAADLLVFTPDPGGSGGGYATFGFRVQDDGGTANAGADLDPVANTITIDVASVNGAPAGTSKTIAVLEDGSHVFTTADFGFTDPTDTPPDSLAAVKVTSLPGAGTVRLDGTPVSTGQSISSAAISGGDLTFAPASNANGAAYASFTFQVQDDGGTAGGGVDLDPSPNTITINVTSVNDAPEGTNGSISVLEGGTFTFDVSDFGFSDPNDSPSNALNTVRFATLPALGVIRLNGSAIDASDSVSIADLNGNDVTYSPAANASGSSYTSFTFQVSDNGGTAGGGANLDLSANTITINVTGVNSAPQGTNHVVAMQEDTVHTFTAPEFEFSDPNDTPPDSLLAVRITTLPDDGVLRNNGVLVTAGQSVSSADIVAGRLRFTPVADGNGGPYASFTFQVRDDGGTANSGIDLDQSPNLMTVNVTPQNDDPTAVDDTRTIDEDSGPATINVLGNDTDIDGDTLTVTAKTNPSDGVLTLTLGVLTYTPDADFFGTDSFDYTVSDGTLADEGRVTITVSAVNDPPVAVDDTANMTEDPGPRVIAVLGNDDDIDGDSLTVLSKTDPAHGTLTLVAGVLTYTPAANYFGSDAFTYTISDGEFTDVGAVAITITSDNDPPDAGDDAVTITRDTAANPVGVLTNDSDVELDPLLITAKTNGAKGTVVITGGGTGLTYDPFTGYLGADTFTYTISDGNGGTDMATVTVNITGANRTPNAVNDVSFSVPEGAAATELDVLANDDDPDGDTFTVVARTNGAHGITRITAGGDAVTYAPNALFDGTDSFTYTIRDAGGLLDTATVVVTVTRDRTAPIVVAPAQRFLGQTVGTSTIKARMTWSGTDVGSGIKSYQLQESVNGRTYTTVALITPTRYYADRVLTNNASYRYRVRATDREGNVSGWRYSQTFKPAVFQETSGLATYTGAWSTYKTTGALGGAVRYTPTLGKKVEFTYTVYDVALVMTRTANSGSADIYIDDVLSTRINLRASRTTYRQLVYTKHFTTLGPHTIEIRPIGTGRVDIDGFAVLR